MKSDMKFKVVGIFILFLWEFGSSQTPDYAKKDWIRQDSIGSTYTFYQGCTRILEELSNESLRDQKSEELVSIVQSNGEESDAVEQFYFELCTERRHELLSPYMDTLEQVIFTPHGYFCGYFFAPTEHQSNFGNRDGWNPPGYLKSLEMNDVFRTVRTLIESPTGQFRDPDVSMDGKRVIFAWKKEDPGDDYHLYEMTLATGEIRQLTFGLGKADFEPIYLPNGNNMFSSTRHVQVIDCSNNPVPNLYLCDKDGRYVRRIGYDQVHTLYPQLLSDGEVIYSRWEYVDRDHVYTHPLFRMRPDGTNQREYYGINSRWPTNFFHPKGIPGSHKAMVVIGGYHMPQYGHIAIVDPSVGRGNGVGVEVITKRGKNTRTDNKPRDKWGEYAKSRFAYPRPFDENAYLASAYFGPEKKLDNPDSAQGIYFMTRDARRELLVPGKWGRSALVIERNYPAPTGDVDFTKDHGTCYVNNVYYGMGSEGIEPGTIKKIRVVSLDYRATAIGGFGICGACGCFTFIPRLPCRRVPSSRR